MHTPSLIELILCFSSVLVKQADYVCTKKFPGGPQKERFLDLEWTLKLDPAEFNHVVVKNQELKDQVWSL